MSAAENARAGGAWVASHPSLLLAVALAVATAGWVRACNRSSAVEADAAAQAEAVQVAKVAAVAEAVSAEGLARMLAAAQAAEAAATGKASGLEEQVKALLGAASGGHVIRVVTGSTGWTKVGGTDHGGPAPGAGGGAGRTPSAPPAPPARVCTLYEDDEGRIDATVVDAKYAAGTVGTVADANAYGRDAVTGAERFLFGNRLKLDVKVLAKMTKPPGWMYGLGVGFSGQGALGALKVETPPRRMPLVGWPVRGWIVAQAGARQGGAILGVDVEP